jgi:hypothetical protein
MITYSDTEKNTTYELLVQVEGAKLSAYYDGKKIGVRW